MKVFLTGAVMKVFFSVCATFALVSLAMLQTPIWDRQGIPPRPEPTPNKEAGPQRVDERTVRGGVAERGLLEIGREWANACVRRDVGKLGAILADDFTFTTPDGSTLNRAQFISSVGESDRAIDDIKVEGEYVRVYEDVALVTGSYAVKTRDLGSRVGGPHRFTAVYVWRSDRWRAVALHSSRVAERSSQEDF
jgi:hypothetical protein